jgi:hypothetical protein
MLVFSLPGLTQNSAKTETKEETYARVIHERAGKIVDSLYIPDSAKYLRVQKIIARQYSDLNNIHEARNAKIKEIKEKYKSDKTRSEALVKEQEDMANQKLDKLHGEYLSRLGTELTAAQVDRVKDGMTYNVLPITYKGYMSMLPNLTEQQKIKIMANLTEAREHAMDAESSEKKHGWFGKYKGRINNFLSSEGYDLNKESEEWHKRTKAEEDAKSQKPK